ncbi:MAG TPA: ATP-binding protein [Terriglobia bacterium]|nr:ATP-binding protein [Terriglobia bacterium]
MSQPKSIPPPCAFDSEKLALKIDEVVPSDVEIIAGEVGKIMALIQQTAPSNDLDGIHLALQEALANAIIHGNGNGSTKAVRICVAVQEDCELLMVVKDSGSGFDPSALPDPIAGQNLFAIRGRGVFLIRQLMDDVWFEFENGTAVYMLKRGSE